MAFGVLLIVGGYLGLVAADCLASGEFDAHRNRLNGYQQLPTDEEEASRAKSRKKK